MNQIIPLKRNRESRDFKSIRLFNPRTEKNMLCCYHSSEEISSLFMEGWVVAKTQKTIQSFLTEISQTDKVFSRDQKRKMGIREWIKHSLINLFLRNMNNRVYYEQ